MVRKPITFQIDFNQEDEKDQITTMTTRCNFSEEDFINNMYDPERFSKENLKLVTKVDLDVLHQYLSEAF